MAVEQLICQHLYHNPTKRFLPKEADFNILTPFQVATLLLMVSSSGPTFSPDTCLALVSPCQVLV